MKPEFMRYFTLERAAALVTVIDFPLLLASLFYAYRQDGLIITSVDNLQKIARSENNIALSQLFFGNPVNLGIIEAIESKTPILKSKGGQFSSTQMDKYLGANNALGRSWLWRLMSGLVRGETSGGFQMTKLSLCVVFTIALLVGVNSIPSLVYAQTDEESAQPSEQPQTDDAAQPDQAATPGEAAEPEEQGDETQGEATDEPENQTDDQSPQDQQ